MRPCFSSTLRAGLFAGFWLFTQALGAAVSNPDWLVRWWQSDEGLPDNNVSGIAQTPDGFLWVATAGGLLRFDGARFQEVPVLNLAGVVNHVVRAMMLDRRGRLWLGMDRGPVVCIEPDAARVFTRDLPDARAVALGEDEKGSVWIAYSDGRVAHLRQDGTVSSMGSQQGLPSIGFCRLLNAGGSLWFAKDHSVGVFQDEKACRLLELSEVVGRIGLRRAGGIWICAGSGVLRYNGTAEEVGEASEVAKLPREVTSDQVTSILEDRTGALWVGTATAGLFRYNGTAMESISTSHREITLLMEDFEGNIWVGTAGGGLNRVRPRMVELLGPDTGLPFESVRSVSEDGVGTLWVTMEDGSLACRSNNCWSNLSKQAQWPGGQATCVGADKQGRVWVGTRDRGLWRYDNEQWRSWHRRDGLASEGVRSLLVASSGALWLTTDGPSRLQGWAENGFANFDLGSRTRILRAMAEDAAGDIWVGSADGQLFRAHQNQIINETTNTSPHLLSIRCLCGTPDGVMWIGYAGWGLGYLKGGHYTRITREAGLYDDYISQIVADGQGWLWCAGNRGIFQVRLEDLRAVAEGRAERVRSVIYGRGEGLRSLQPTYDHVPGAIRGRDGRLWFPMRTGLTVVNAGILPHNAAPPPVWIERVAADGQSMATYNGRSPLRVAGKGVTTDLSGTNATLELGPAHRKLDIEFTALSFTAPENVHFQYRMEGFDEDWIETDFRETTYPRLPAGDYRFRVKACNNDGVWNQNGAVLSLVVLPFFWQTWWFRAVLLALFTLSLIAVVRYASFRRLRRQLLRLEQQAALHRERARIARDIHDDLGANLTQIALLGQLAQQDTAAPAKAAERIGTISATARQAIKSLDEIVWAVNPRNDTLAHLLDYAGQFALDYLSLAGIRCRLDLPEQIPEREISTDIRHNLFLAVKETLNNIVKHAQATEVRLRLGIGETALQLIIEDNGRGFEDAPDNALADGLRNIRQRLADIGGVCRIESRLEAGTTVTLEVPWSNG